MSKTSQQIVNEIMNRIAAGERYAEIAKACNVSLSTVYNTANRNGIVAKRALADYADELAAARKSGLSYEEISKRYGVCAQTVKAEMERLGIEYSADELAEMQFVRAKSRRHSDEEVSVMLAEIGLEYVGGYDNMITTMTVRTVECGHTWQGSLNNIMRRYTECPVCRKERKAEERKRIKAEAERLKAEKELAKIEAEREREAEAERERMEIAERRKHPCPVCGEITDRRLYCSKKCANRVYNKRHEVRQRRMAAAMIDKDISLDALYKRDGGICHICGKPCRLDDYVISEDAFIAGNWYPSIDHVVPLSKGGEHSWSNVALAHRYCNSIKGDKT